MVCIQPCCATLNSLASLRALAWAVLLARRGRCSLAASAKTCSLSRNLRAAGRPASAVTLKLGEHWCDRPPDGVVHALLPKASSSRQTSLQQWLQGSAHLLSCAEESCAVQVAHTHRGRLPRSRWQQDPPPWWQTTSIWESTLLACRGDSSSPRGLPALVWGSADACATGSQDEGVTISCSKLSCGRATVLRLQSAGVPQRLGLRPGLSLVASILKLWQTQMTT